MNVPYVDVNGILPISDSPAAMSTMSASAMPQSMNRSGNSFLKRSVVVDLARSASSTNTSGSALPRISRPSEYPKRVALPSSLPRTSLCAVAMSLTLLCVQLAYGLGQLVLGRRLAMPADNVLHIGDALAFDGMRNDGGGLSLDRFRLVQRVHALLHIIAVDADDVPVERAQLSGDVIDAHDLGTLAVNLQTVVVDDGTQVVQLEVRTRHQCFPDLALLDLSVTGETVGTDRQLVVPGGICCTNGDGEPLTKRAARCLDTGRAPLLRVPLEA